MHRPHIVIVGAGFGGVYTARELLPWVEKKLIDVTIINKTNYFLFTPLLHEVATGSLRPTSVSESLREIFKKTKINVYQCDVTSIDTKNKKIITEMCEMPYNYLVLSTGAETNYYGISGAKENSLPLKNLFDAVQIREKIINSFEKAVLTNEEVEKKRLLSFVVVGGGATGVETVAEVAEFVEEIKNKYYRKNKKSKISESSVKLVSSDKKLLKQFHPKIQVTAEKRLRELNVNIVFDKKVSSIEQGVINFSDGPSTSAETVVWTAGVVPIVPKFIGEEISLVAGRLQTNTYLEVEKQQNIFALGDNAGDSPMLAQVATAEAKIVAKNIIAKIKGQNLTPFVYKPKGSLISLGKWNASGEIFGFVISGKLAWWIWRTIYLFKFNSWNKRLHIAFDWTVDIFYPRDITKLM